MFLKYVQCSIVYRRFSVVNDKWRRQLNNNTLKICVHVHGSVFLWWQFGKVFKLYRYTTFFIHHHSSSSGVSVTNLPPFRQHTCSFSSHLPDLKNSKVLIDSSTTLHNTTPFCPPTRKPALPRYNFLLPSHLKNPSPVFRPNLLSATIFSNNSMASGAWNAGSSG